MTFFSTKTRVSNRGVPPDAFLAELVEWGRKADAEIFAPNPNPYDIYAYIKPILGPWASLLHRRAALLEEMRVHAGFESSWKFGEGVDLTNQHSVHHKDGEETGAWQVSFDSTYIDGGALVNGVWKERQVKDVMKPFAVAHGIGTVDSFIPQMKADHKLAMEYYARLVRVNVQWAGPIKRHEIDPFLSRSAVAEFMALLGG